MADKKSAKPEAEMARVQDFLGVARSLGAADLAREHNAAETHTLVREPASPRVRRVLGCFFAPHNARLYAWAEARGTPLAPWPREDGDGEACTDSDVAPFAGGR